MKTNHLFPVGGLGTTVIVVMGLLLSFSVSAQNNIEIVGPNLCGPNSTGVVSESEVYTITSNFWDATDHTIKVKGGVISAFRFRDTDPWFFFTERDLTSISLNVDWDFNVNFGQVRVEWDGTQPEQTIESAMKEKIKYSFPKEKDETSNPWDLKTSFGITLSSESETLVVRDVPRMGPVEYNSPICKGSRTRLESSFEGACLGSDPIGYNWFINGVRISTTQDPVLERTIDRDRANSVVVSPVLASSDYIQRGFPSSGRITNVDDVSRSFTLPVSRRYTQISGPSRVVNGEWANFNVQSNESASAYEWRFSNNNIAISQGSRTSSYVRLVCRGDWPASFTVSCRVTTCSGTVWVSKTVSGVGGNAPSGPGGPAIPLVDNQGADFDVYPNPVAIGATLHLPRDISWTENSYVLDAGGKLVSVVAHAEATQFELEATVPGVYMLHVPESDFRTTFLLR